MATVVALHAIAADIPVLTGATIGRLRDAGHRVVVITLTGEAPAGLAESLGAARTETLGGAYEPAAPAQLPPDALDAVRELLESERDIALIIGHDPTVMELDPTHIAVGALAAALAEQLQVPLVNATLPREIIEKGERLAKSLDTTIPLTGDQLAQFPTKSSVDFKISPLVHVGAKWSAVTELASSEDAVSRGIAAVMRLPRMMVSALLKLEYFNLGEHTSLEQVPEFFTELAS